MPKPTTAVPNSCWKQKTPVKKPWPICSKPPKWGISRRNTSWANGTAKVKMCRRIMLPRSIGWSVPLLQAT